jgi:tape measure domain-containing protein
MAGRPIDEKIVVMRLDNSDFTKNAADTTSKLGLLRDSLNKIPGVNLGKTAQELGQIQNAANSTTMDKLAGSVQSIAGRFTNLGIIGVTALTNIANKAVNAGLALAKSLTIAPITAGFGEYETKIGSIKTILSNTQWSGTGLKDVNGALNELNTYADQTIYNFSEMTSNIGRFTAAGVKLDDSVSSIKGLSNLAAASGSTSDQLSSAMYQMSQAMAAGKISLMDWNSLVNSGMGGKKTQDALLETAKAMGKNVDLSEGFRGSLEKGWLTSDVFLATMKKFGADESMIEAATKVRTFSAMMDTLKESVASGWATTWENVFGNYDQATELWSTLTAKITQSITKSSKARNDFIKGLADKGAFTNIFTGIENAVKPVMQIFSALSYGFKRVFPPVSIDQIVKATEKFKEFTAGLMPSQETFGKLITVFQGGFSVFSSVWEIVKGLGSAFLNLIPKGTGGGILDLLVKIAELSIKFNESIKSGNVLTHSIEALGKVLGAVGRGVKDAIGSVIDFSGSLRDNLGNAIDWIKEKLAPVGKFLKETFGGFGGDDLLGAGTLVGVGLVIKKIITLFGKFGGTVDSFKDMISNIGEGIGGVFEDLGGALKSFTSQVKYNNLLKIAIAVGILAVSLKLLEGMKTADIVRGIGALGTSLGVMMGAMSIMDKFKITGGLKASVTIIALSVAVLIMAGALKKISDLNPQELMTGIGGLIGITGALALAIIAISKWGGKLKVGSIQLIALATAVYILASAVKKMAEIDPGDLFKAIGALGILFLELAIFLKIVDRTKFGISSAIGLIAVAAALHVMVSAIQKIDKLDKDTLIKGLITIGIILAEIALFSRLASGPSLMASGIGLLLIAAAINALVGPITTLGKMTWEQLAKGLGGMAVALVALGLAAMLMSGNLAGVVGIALMAVALNLLMIPIKIFSEMSWEQLAKGFVGLAGGLVIVATASLLLAPAVVPMLAFGAALLVIGIGVLAAGAGIALFGVGLATLATLTAVSVGAIILALGLLIRGFGTLIVDIVQVVVNLGVALIKGLLALIPPLAEAIAIIIIKLLETITTYLPTFIELGTKLIVQLLEGLAIAIPTILDAAVKFMITLIEGMAKAIRDNGPQLISAILELVGEILLLVIEAGVQVIQALFGWIPGVTAATSKVGKEAEKAIRDSFGAYNAGKDKGDEFTKSLSDTAPDARAAGITVGTGGLEGVSSIDFKPIGTNKGVDFTKYLGAQTPGANTAGVNLATAGKTGAGSVDMAPTGTNLGTIFTKALGGQAPNAKTAGVNLANAGVGGAGSVNGTPTGTNLGADLSNALGSQTPAAKAAGIKLANAGVTGAGSVNMSTTGANFGQGFANGIGSKIGSVESAARSLASAAASRVKNWLEIKSPSRITLGFGKFFGEGLALGIEDKVKRVGSSAKDLALTAKDSLNQFLDGFELPADDNELHFKAVVDYDQLDVNKFGSVAPLTIKPDTSLTNGLLTATKINLGQNGDKTPSNVDSSVTKTYNNYEIKVESKGISSRSEIKKLAGQIQTELKNLNDRTKISRGEGVVF